MTGSFNSADSEATDGEQVGEVKCLELRRETI